MIRCLLSGDNTYLLSNTCICMTFQGSKVHEYFSLRSDTRHTMYATQFHKQDLLGTSKVMLCNPLELIKWYLSRKRRRIVLPHPHSVHMYTVPTAVMQCRGHTCNESHNGKCRLCIMIKMAHCLIVYNVMHACTQVLMAVNVNCCRSGLGPVCIKIMHFIMCHVYHAVPEVKGEGSSPHYMNTHHNNIHMTTERCCLKMCIM